MTRPPDHANPDPFKLLNLPPTYDLDPETLRATWLKLAARLHPDIAPDPEQAGRELAVLSAARDTLADPEARADALLVHLAGPTREQLNELPPAFLMEIMEIREQLEHATETADANAINELHQWAEQERNRYTKDLAQRFKALPSPPDQQSLNDIRIQLNAWRYIERMLEQIPHPTRSTETKPPTTPTP